jgi:hypothetical protein
VVERAPDRRRNRARPSADLDDLTLRVVQHDHPTRIAREALGRFCGNVRPAIEDGLARRLAIGQHRGVDVNDDLVALAWGARVEIVMERGLREKSQRVSLLLFDRGRFCGGNYALDKAS